MAAFTRLSDASKVVQWAGQLVRDLGRSVRYVAFGEVTLAPSQTSTVVSDSACRAGSKVLLTAETANAAAALATTFIAPADVVQGRFMVRHGSVATTDRTFSYAVFEPAERTR
ncbi:MAG: hypothetical protein HC871_12920 [Rhizobiales bacterium]|nr:hypothetical protein [Hyphomicrobiales bacterium]